MIKLNGSRITDILPPSLSSQPEVQAFSYALSRQIAKVCEYSDNARLYAFIEEIDSNAVLDILAMSLHTPGYRTDYAIEIKRNLVKNSFLYRLRLGTPSAVEQFIKDVFSGGWIEEWFEYSIFNPYTPLPHHFTVFTYSYVDDETLAAFRREIDRVKRLSSWMDGVIQVVERKFRDSIYLVGGGFVTDKEQIEPANFGNDLRGGVYPVVGGFNQTHVRLTRQN